MSAFKLASAPLTLGRWHVAVDPELWFSVEDKSAAWNDTFAHPDAYHELGSNPAFPKPRARVGVMTDLGLGVDFSAQSSAN